jgi:hypothetical protein
MIPTKAVALLVLAVILASSCVGRVAQQVDDHGEYPSTSLSMSLHGSKDAALIERGRQYVMESKFDAAVEAFMEVYQNKQAEPEHRAEALFQLGGVYANILYPKRDEKTARTYYEELIADFPESDFRSNAEEALRRMAPSN